MKGRGADMKIKLDRTSGAVEREGSLPDGVIEAFGKLLADYATEKEKAVDGQGQQPA